MSGEPVDIVLKRAERELATARRLSAELRGMIEEVEERERRNAPVPRPHLYIVE